MSGECIDDPESQRVDIHWRETAFLNAKMSLVLHGKFDGKGMIDY